MAEQTITYDQASGINGGKLDWQPIENQYTFSGATGTIGQKTLFTVTGKIAIRNMGGLVNTTLVGVGATISVGTANNVDGLFAVTTATDLAAGDIWTMVGGDSVEVGATNAATGQIHYLKDAENITFDILVANITAGRLDMQILWAPLEKGASLVAA